MQVGHMGALNQNIRSLTVSNAASVFQGNMNLHSGALDEEAELNEESAILVACVKKAGLL